MVSQTLYPSSSVPFKLPPATPSTRVGNQSLTWTSSRLTVPLTLGSRRGLVTNPTPCMPPSQRVFFRPLRGQLLPPEDGMPPLSEEKKEKKCYFVYISKQI